MRRAFALALGLFFSGLICLSQVAPAQILLTGAGAQKAASAATTTWNPSDKSADIALTGGNLVATKNANDGAASMVRSVSSAASGKKFSQTAVDVQADNWVFGIANGTESLSNIIGQSVNSAGYNFSGSVIGCGFATLGTGESFAAGATVSFAYDIGAKLIWVRKNSGNWNNDAGADPATGTNGFDASCVAAGPYFAAWGPTKTNDKTTTNFGGSAYSPAAPSGFTNW